MAKVLSLVFVLLDCLVPSPFRVIYLEVEILWFMPPTFIILTALWRTTCDFAHQALLLFSVQHWKAGWSLGTRLLSEHNNVYQLDPSVQYTNLLECTANCSTLLHWEVIVHLIIIVRDRHTVHTDIQWWWRVPVRSWLICFCGVIVMTIG